MERPGQISPADEFRSALASVWTAGCYAGSQVSSAWVGRAPVRGLGAGGKPERDEQAVLIRGLGLDETEAAVGDEDAGDEESTDHR